MYITVSDAAEENLKYQEGVFKFYVNRDVLRVPAELTVYG